MAQPNLSFSSESALVALAVLVRLATLRTWRGVEARLVDKKPDAGACRVGSRWIVLTDEERAALTLVQPTVEDAPAVQAPKQRKVYATIGRILELKAEGWSVRKIAEHLQVTPSAISHRLSASRGATVRHRGAS